MPPFILSGSGMDDRLTPIHRVGGGGGCVLSVSKLGDADAWSSAANNGYGHSSVVSGSVIQQQSAGYASNGYSAVVFNDGGTFKFTRWTRSINFDGTQIGEASETIPTIGNGDQMQLISVQNNSSIQMARQPAAGIGAGVAAWFVNGVKGTTIKPPSGSDHYHAVARSTPKPQCTAMFVPGAGVYVMNGLTTTWITLYPATNDSVPTVFAETTDTDLAGFDSSGRIYTVNSTGSTLRQWTAGLTEITTFANPLAASRATESNTVICGRYWCTGRNTAGGGGLFIYDLEDGLAQVGFLALDTQSGARTSMVMPHHVYCQFALESVQIAA